MKRSLDGCYYSIFPAAIRETYPYITGLESVRSISQTHVQYIKCVCVCAWLFLQPLPYMDMTESSIYPIVNNKYPSGCYRISTQPIVTFDSTCCPVSATTKAGSNDNQTPPEPAVLVSGEKDGLHEMWCQSQCCRKNQPIAGDVNIELPSCPYFWFFVVDFVLFLDKTDSLRPTHQSLKLP